MNAEKFEHLCNELLLESQRTLFNKSKEYASDEDRLANFRQPTSMTQMSTAEVCLMCQMKHIASITKIAKESSKGILPPKELLLEKCQDVLNYTLIFYAAMRELISESARSIESDTPIIHHLDQDHLSPCSTECSDLTQFLDPDTSLCSFHGHEKLNNECHFGCTNSGAEE